MSPTAASLDIKCVTQKFQACQIGEEDVTLELYCDAYDEVGKLLAYFGKLFHFVSRDVESKISELRSLLGKDPSHYETVKTMADYELELNIGIASKKQKHPGCRTLLRLHRALLFVIELMREMCVAPEEEQLRVLARRAYEENLAQYHPWAVRKAVNIAVYTLPTREQFIQHITDGQPYESRLLTREQCRDAITHDCLPSMRGTYDRIQKIFIKYDMLDLP